MCSQPLWATAAHPWRRVPLLMVHGEPGAPRGGCPRHTGLGTQQLRVCDSPWRCRTGLTEGVVAGRRCEGRNVSHSGHRRASQWEVGVARHPGQTEKVRPCPCRWLHQGGPLPRAVSASSPEACLLFQGLARPTFRDPRIVRSALVTGVPALTVGPTASPVWESFWICTHS